MAADLAQFRARVKSLKCASNEIEALTELWLQALDSFLCFYGGIPDALLTKPIDSEGTHAIAVGQHVMRAGLCHITWSLELGGLPGPDKQRPTLAQVRAHKAVFETKALVLAEGARLAQIIPPALAPMTNEHLSHQGTSWWGEGMSSETMIEHAIMHYYRHQRQLAVRLLS